MMAEEQVKKPTFFDELVAVYPKPVQRYLLWSLDFLNKIKKYIPQMLFYMLTIFIFMNIYNVYGFEKTLIIMGVSFMFRSARKKNG